MSRNYETKAPRTFYAASLPVFAEELSLECRALGSRLERAAQLGMTPKLATRIKESESLITELMEKFKVSSDWTREYIESGRDLERQRIEFERSENE